MSRRLSDISKAFHSVSLFIAILAVVTVLTLVVSPIATAQALQAQQGASVSAITSASDVPLFLPAVTYSSGGFEPGLIAVTDVNRDGKADVVVPNFRCANIAGGTCTGNGSVGVLLSNGDGTFQPAMEFDSGAASAISLAIADVNGDGNPDLLITNFYYTFDVLLGNGDGTFQPAQVYDSGGQFPIFIAAADLNGDTHVDLVVAQRFGSIALLFGNGDGSFRTPVIYDWGISYIGIGAVAIADVNRDGRPDLLVASGTEGEIESLKQDMQVVVLLGKGDGTFQLPTNYSTGGRYPTSLEVADINNDGRLDLLVANSYSDTVGVLLGNGDGTFQMPTTYQSGGVSGNMGLAVEDVNGDGQPDLLVPNRCNTKSCLEEAVVSVLLGNGNGTYQPAVTFQSGGYFADWVALRDINGDGFPDILVANRCGTNFNCGGAGDVGSVGVLLNNSGMRKVTSITTLVSSRNPSVSGQVVTFTATVGSSSGAPPNGEPITFKNGATILGTIPLSAGKASLSTSALPAGIFTITAQYPGDSSLAASTSTGLIQTVNSANKSVTTTTLLSNLNPSVYGQSVIFMAQVTTSGKVPPTGTVVFMWKYFTRTYTIGSATLNSSGVATLAKSSLNADPYPMIAVYNGDVNNLGSTSAVFSQVVTQATSSASINSSLNPSAQGQGVTFTAKITSPTVVPSGPVTFKAGTTVLGTAQLSGGKAIFTTSTLPAGSSVVKVTYNGNSNIKGSSGSVAQTVQP